MTGPAVRTGEARYRDETWPDPAPERDAHGGRPADARARRVLRAAEDLRLLAPALAAWGLLAATLGIGWRWQALLAALLLAGTGATVLLHRRWAAILALTCALAALTLGGAAAWGAARDAGPVTALAQDGAAVELEGSLAAEPRLRRAINPGEGKDLVIVAVDVDRVTARGVTTQVSTRVLVLADRAWADRHWLEQMRFTGTLAPADAGDDVVAVARVSRAETVEPPPLPVRVAATIRARLRAACADLPPDAAGLVTGLSVGDTTLQPRGLGDAMKETSLTHLSAVSGSNIALVVGATLVLCAAAGAPRRARPPLAACVLVVYVVVCGLEPSVLRAGVMGSVALLGLARSRARSSLPGLGAAIIVLLVWDPWLARSPGFALSCLATLGLVVLARPWADAIGRRLPDRWRWVGEALAVPLAAHLACAPVVVALSGRVPVVGLLANILVAPLVAPVTVLGLVAAVVALISVPAATWPAWGAAIPAAGIEWVARRLADWPVASLPWFGGWWGPVLLALLVAAVLAAGPWLALRVRRRPLLAAFLVAVVIAVWVPLPRLGWPPAGWQAVVCDVGQGDALVFATGEAGSAVLVDTGPPDGHVERCLDRLGVRRLDALVLTHYHDDHAGRAVELIRDRPVGQVLVTALAEPEAAARAVGGAAAERGVPVTVADAGQELVWGSVTARVLGPRAVGRGEAAINDASLVLAVTAGPSRVLVTGDLERGGAKAVVPAVRAEVRDHGPFTALKVAHHGSRNQEAELVCATGAGLALLSVGADNDFGHPARETLTLLARCGLAVERTDEHGDLALTGDGRVGRFR